MKTIRLLAFVLLSTSAFRATAQTAFVQGQDGLMDLKAGPLITAGAAANAGDVASGSKTSPGFAYTPGALLDFTYTRNVGFDLGVVYDARTINFHDQANSNLGVNYNFGYISLRPELRFSGFLIGVGLGLPVSVSTTALGGAATPNLKPGDVNALFEGRIGGIVELLRSDLGTLNFHVEGSYAFSKNIESAWFHGADATLNNGPLATAELGISYLFDLTPFAPAPPPAAAVESSH